MAWFRREKQKLQPAEGSRSRTEGLWTKCEGCRQIIWKKDLEANWQVCPKCQYHFRLNARARLRLLMDNGEWQEHDSEIETTDPLAFVDLKPYADRVRAAQKATSLSDAVITAEGRLDGIPVLICSMEYGFIGGSMGGVVPRRGAGLPEQSPAGGGFGIGRCAHDGRHRQFDADGQGLRGPCPAR